MSPRNNQTKTFFSDLRFPQNNKSGSN